MPRTIVSAKWIVTGCDRENVPEVIEDGAVLAKDGTIEAVGRRVDLVAQAPDAERTEHPGHVMLPGFVNSHHHVGMTPLQVGSPDLALELWLSYRNFERRADLYLDTLYSAFELIASGVTTVAHVNGPLPGGLASLDADATAILKAYRDIGMRASFSIMARDQNRLVYEQDETFCARLPQDLGEQLAAHLSRHRVTIKDSLDLFDGLREANAGERLTSIQLAPANLHWCSDNALLDLNAKARSADVPMHMHLLETVYQKQYARLRSDGGTAIDYLDRMGILGPHLTLGHGVWLTENDIDVVAGTGTCVCHNCSSNFRLRSGTAPLNALEARGVTTAIGIDEAGVNDDRDMLQEMRMVLRAHRVPGLDDEEVPSAPQVLRMATEGGAMTTGFGRRIGRLEPGRFFDGVLLDWNEITYPYQDDAIPLVDVILNRAKTGSIKAVYIDGVVVYSDGRFTRVDRDAIHSEIADQMTVPPTERQRREKALARELVPYVKDFYRGYLPDAGGTPFYRTSATR